MSRHSDVCGQRLSGANPRDAANCDCRRSGPTWTARLIRSAALLAAVGAATTAVWIMVRPDVLDSSRSNTLLSKLAALAQDGPRVLCDPAQLEKRLPIQIGKMTPQLGNSGSVSIVSSGGAPGFDTTGTYSQSRVLTVTVCRLRLRFPSHPFCATDSASVQRLLGARVQYGLATLGEPGRFDHGYVFLRHHLHRSIIGWREPPGPCLADVEILSEQA